MPLADGTLGQRRSTSCACRHTQSSRKKRTNLPLHCPADSAAATRRHPPHRSPRPTTRLAGGSASRCRSCSKPPASDATKYQCPSMPCVRLIARTLIRTVRPTTCSAAIPCCWRAEMTPQLLVPRHQHHNLILGALRQPTVRWRRYGVGSYHIRMRDGCGKERLSSAFYLGGCALQAVLHNLDGHQSALPPPCH